MNFQEIHAQLLGPAAYPEPTRAVAFCETHISRVYLTDTHAYKLKKPLDLGFLDFSTLERRGFFCHEEVRLNRRFAPGTYLGVVELREEGGRLRFGGSGTLVDYAVQMRRLPEARMLDRLLDAGAAELPTEIGRLARHLAILFTASPVCRGEAPGGNAGEIRANWSENLAQTERAVGGPLSAAAHRAMSALIVAELDRLTPRFADREARGFVRDGHGDLHPRNICMTEPIQVYDCIEFCRRFRVTDLAGELAFLLMDLDFRGRRDLARSFLDVYLQHAPDPELATLLPFYKSQRAWIRGKVEAVLAGEDEVAEELRSMALERSRRYFNLALGYHVPPMLLLTAGLMGVGKTTLARALAIALGAEMLRSDVIRKELAGIPPGRPGPESFAEGLYAPAMTARTYAELLHRAEGPLRRGDTVIVDAAFADNADRRQFFALAGRLGVPVRLLHLHCERELALARLDRRQAEGLDASDGRREVAAAQAAAFEAVPAGPRVIAIDSSAAVDYNVQETICRLLAG